MKDTNSTDGNQPNNHDNSALSPTLATLQKLALGQATTQEETIAFEDTVIRPACFSNGAQRREIDEAKQVGWEALLSPIGKNGITACGKVWEMFLQGDLSESKAMAYLGAAARNAIGRLARRTAIGRLYEAVKGALGNTSGFSIVEDGNKRKFYAPAHGHRWALAGDDLDTKTVAREIAEQLGLLGLRGPLPTKLRATILPIIRASFDLLETRLDVGQLTNIIVEAMGLGGLRGQPISLDQSKSEEDGGVGLEAEVSSAWADQQGTDTTSPEDDDASPKEAVTVADAWEAHWHAHDGRFFAQAVEEPGNKGSDAPVMLAMLSGATLEEMARYCGSGVSAVQGRLGSRGWAPQKLSKELETWQASGRANRERFPVPPKLVLILGPLMNPRSEVARAAWEVLRRRYASVIGQLKSAA